MAGFPPPPWCGAVFAAAALLAVGAVGCSSEDPPRVAAANDAAPESDADAGESCVAVDASLVIIEPDAMAAGPFASCVQSTCVAQRTACNDDCACKNAVFAILECIRGGAGVEMCVLEASTNAAANATLGSLLMCEEQCMPTGDAGLGGADAGDAETDEGVDAIFGAADVGPPAADSARSSARA